MSGEIIRSALLLCLAACALKMKTQEQELERVSCWAYKCSQMTSTCVYPIASNKTYIVSSCSESKPYCDTSVITANVSCSATSPTVTYTSYPGEPCTTTTDCVSGTCINKICFGAVLLSTCSSYLDCNPGLRCSRGVCTTLLKLGGTCTSDFDCVTNSGCNNGVCTSYLSLPVGSIVSDCFDGQSSSLFCEESSCVYSSSAGVGVCVPGFVSENSGECTRSRECLGVSIMNSTFNYTETSTCECGMNPDRTMHCSAHDGDLTAIAFRTYWKAFVNAGLVDKCNTARRYDLACIGLSTGNIKYTRLMNAYYNYYYLPQLYKIPSCILDTFFSGYSTANYIYISSLILLLIL